MNQEENKTLLEQAKAVKTAWPIFVFIGTLVVNNLTHRNMIETQMKELDYRYQLEIVELRHKDDDNAKEIDGVRNSVAWLQQNVEKNYKRK